MEKKIMSQIQVTKRNGSRELLDLAKFHRVTAWACEGLNGVSESLIELKSHVQFYDKIQTKEIQETLIKAAAELISEENPNYQYVASRLINYGLRKEVYNHHEPCDLLQHIKNIVNVGYYDAEILKFYPEEEINWLNKQLDHSRDFHIAYAGMEQFRGKYLVKNRATKQYYETPQMAFMLIAMTLFAKYTENRLQWVKDFYDAVSTFEISLPTPIMAGLRTPQRQFSSCVLIESDDSLDSIIATTGAIIKYVSQKAGIGIGAGLLRAVGSPVRNGDATSEGNIPYYKLFQSATKSCSQGGVRGGSATIHTTFWHLEIEDLLVLKNNKGTDETRVRHMDYSIQFNKVMYERLLSGGNITLFSPNDVPDLYEAFFVDTDKFRELYVKYENTPKIRKKIVSAIDLFSAFLQERKDTGRIYLQNVDHANDHSSFLKHMAPIKQSNLCLSGDTWITVELENGELKDIQLQEAIETSSNLKVFSRNIKTGKDQFKKITAKAKTGINQKVMKITDEFGDFIICTPEHKIYTKNRGYVEAKNLRETDILQKLK
jgi:ribonucleoside-diphosphate reductase alpha chain